MRELDLNDVRSFVAIAQAGTLTAAAKELHLPASTVSRAMNRLEKHLGVLLLKRSPRGAVLTDSGKDTYKRADAHCGPLKTAVSCSKCADQDQAGS